MQTIREIILNAGRIRPLALGRPFDHDRGTALGRFLWAFAV